MSTVNCMQFVTLCSLPHEEPRAITGSWWMCGSSCGLRDSFKCTKCILYLRAVDILRTVLIEVFVILNTPNITPPRRPWSHSRMKSRVRMELVSKSICTIRSKLLTSLNTQTFKTLEEKYPQVVFLTLALEANVLWSKYKKYAMHYDKGNDTHVIYFGRHWQTYGDYLQSSIWVKTVGVCIIAISYLCIIQHYQTMPCITE